MLESVVGTIRVNLYQLPTDRLDSMAATGAVCPQLLDELHHEENPIQSPHGVYTETAHLYVPVTYARGSQPPQSTTDGPDDSTNSHQKCPIDAPKTCPQEQGSAPLPPLCS
jgi:hypothetical protein